MSKLSVIEQTKKAKEQYSHEIIDILLERHTKEELVVILHCSNRKARNIIAECSMHYPIIALSKNSGYRRAKNIDDLSGEALEEEMDIVCKVIAEHRSRIKVLKKKMKPLIAWLKVAEKKRSKEVNPNDES